VNFHHVFYWETGGVKCEAAQLQVVNEFFNGVDRGIVFRFDSFHVELKVFETKLLDQRQVILQLEMGERTVGNA
jgi:hypothetical protein